MLLLAVLGATGPLHAGELATIAVTARQGGARYAATGTVQAVRQSTLAAQVTGRVSEVLVRNGDAVRAGQVLLRIEAGDSLDSAAASAFGAEGAAARLASARADYERAQRLRAQDYISVAAMQRAEASWRSAAAEARSAGAGARAAQTRAAWHVIKAPFAGHVTELHASVGDLATPGRALLGMYDPAAMRLIAHIPEGLASQIARDKPAYLVAADPKGVSNTTMLDSWWMISAVDAATHSVEVRAQLPSGSLLQPGQFARLMLPLSSTATQLRIPLKAIVYRSEVSGAYVVGGDGRAHLRQLRLGPVDGAEVVVLAGLQAGERVALDPVAAARN
jgi:RND family efflux transporter MFP subunit